MQSFIHQAASAFIECVPASEFRNSLILFPSRRAVFFFERELEKQLSANCWLPRCISIEDFVEELSGRRLMRSTELLLEFYDVYRNTVSESNQDSLDRFVQWAPGMLSDFNEMDAYMIPHEKLFKEIRDVKNLERWNPAGEEATVLQKAYLKLWDDMAELYNGIHSVFNRTSSGYNGALYRKCASSFISHKKKVYPHIHNAWFIGFNALNKCEEVIIDSWVTTGNVKLVWDSEDYYFKDKHQEAGLFLRKHTTRWPDCNLFINSTGLTTPKTIRVYQGAGADGVAQVAASVIHARIPKGEQEEAALIPADESGLMSAMYGLPESLEHFNVTAGMGLDASVFADWFVQFIKLLFSKKKSGAFYHRTLWSFLKHPGTKSLIISDYELHRLRQSHINRNTIYVSPIKLKEELSGVIHQAVVDELISSESSPLKLIQSGNRLLTVLFDSYHSSQEEDDVFVTEQILGIQQAVKKLSEYIDRYSASWTQSSLLLFLRQLFSGETIQFVGEPLKGLQIMGMLESRVLDFKRVILTHVNEGVLPAGKTSGSFIPFDVKRAYGLPTHYEKDAIYAYHFYRVIQRAEEVYLIYDNETEGVKHAEESRFIKQLEVEWQNTDKDRLLLREHFSSATEPLDFKSFSVQKDQEVISKVLNLLVNKGLSPSAFVKYVTSPADFYLRYILGLSEEEEVTEVIEDRDTGNIIHEVLEEYLKPHVRKVLTADVYEELKNSASKRIREKFLHALRIEEITGKNHLTFTFMKVFMKNFITFEEKRLKKNTITLLGVEEGSRNSDSSFFRILETDLASFKIKGIADRIERDESSHTIIDYKTGVVEAKELAVKSVEELFTDPSKSKALQLVWYAWIYRSRIPKDMQLKSAIYSFPKSSFGLIFAKVSGSEVITDDVLAEFEEYLLNSIHEMLNPEIPFTNKLDAKYTLFDMKSPEEGYSF